MAAARPSLLLLPIIYLGFVSLGLPDGTIGVAWPQMHESLGLPIGLGGTIVLVVTLLSGVSGFASGRLIARFNTGPVVLVSCALTGTALLMVAHAPNFGWLMAAAAPLGFGAGAVDAGLNGFVARHYSGRHMNWLHASWGIGATCGPLVLAHTLASGTGWRGGYFVIGSAQLVLALVFLVTLRLWRAVPERGIASSSADRPASSPTMPANSPAGWLSAAIFTIYVAAEATAGVWAVSILVVSRGVSQETAGLCAAVFYGAITVGRVGVGFLGDRWSNRKAVSTGIAIALVGALLFALAQSTFLAAAALVLLGGGLAPVYPGLMHEVPRRFAPDSVQVVIGRQSGAAYVGAALLPAASGALAQHSLEGVAWLVVIGVVLLLAAVHRLNRLT